MPVRWENAPAAKPKIRWEEPARAEPLPDMSAEAATAGAAGDDTPFFTRSPIKTFEKGAASVGRGLIADVIGGPVDIMAGGINAIRAANDMTVGRVFDLPSLPRIEQPFMGSDFIADTASKAYSMLGGNIIPDEELSPAERIMHSGLRFGSSALGGGAALARQVGRNAPKVIEALAEPYKTNAPRTLIGDVAGGSGSGIALGRYEEVTPEEQQGPLGALLAALIGNLGGVTAANLARSTGSGIYRSLPGKNYDPKVGIDKTTGYRPTIAEVDRAAQLAQGSAVNPNAAAKEIEETTRSLDDIAPRSSQPTTGAQSADPGLTIMENTFRAQDTKPFLVRDRNVHARARHLMDETAPVGASGRDFTDAVDQRMAGAFRDIDAEASQARQSVSDNVTQPSNPLDAYRGRGAEASRSIDAKFRQNLEKETETKSGLYNDPNLVDAPVSAEPIYMAADDMAKSLGPVGDPNSIPGDIIGRIRGLAKFDEETGDLIGFKNITYGDVQDLRAQVSKELSEARAASGNSESGSGPRVRNLLKLRSVLDDYIEDLAASDGDVAVAAQRAIQNYRENYAPRFKQGRAGDLTRAIRSDGTGTRTRPEDTAGKFLGGGKGDDAESLFRAVPDAAPEAREYLLDDLAKANPIDSKTGAVKADTLQRWMDRNREVINRVPGMQEELDKVLAAANEGKKVTGAIAERLRQIETDASAKRRAVEKGPLGAAAGKSPRKAVEAVFNSGDPEVNMRKLVDEIGDDAKARDGLKAAIVETMIDRNSTSALQKTLSGDRPISFAKLENFFNDHSDVLAQVYSPDEMNALRASHKLLKPMGNLALRGTSGSDTAEKAAAMRNDKRWNIIEAGLKAKYGVLLGGSYLRTMKIAAKTLDTGESNPVDDLVLRMMFDPDLAIHLLRKDVSHLAAPEWNRKLQMLLGIAAASRESTDD